MNNKFNVFYNLILDSLEEKLFKIPIFEMASKRNTAWDRISDQSENLFCHILYIITHPESNSINHWKGEIRNFIKIMGNAPNKLPKRFDSSSLYEILGNDDNTIKFSIQRYKSKFNHLPDNYHIQTTLSII